MKELRLLAVVLLISIITSGCGISKTMKSYQVEYVDRPDVIEQTDNTKAYSSLEYTFLEDYQSWFLQTRNPIAPRCEIFVYNDDQKSRQLYHMETSVYGEAFIDLGSDAPQTIFVTLQEKNRLESAISVFSKN